MKWDGASPLTNLELLAAAERLAGAERRCVAELVVFLAEIERRRLHLAQGFPSLHAYCVTVLRLSDYEAFARIEASRAGQRFPRVFEMLLDGSLSLTTAQLVARQLTPENHKALLAEAAGKTKNDTLRLLARWFPQPDAPASVRKIATTPAAVPEVSSARSVTVEASVPAAQTALTVPVVPRAVVAPLAPDRYKVTFTADEETIELLALAKDMLSHAVPNGDTAAVLKRALKALVSDLARTRFAATRRPRKSHGPKDECDVAAAVKREVWARDGGRCAFVGTSGRRCCSRWQVQFHHLDERCRRGKGTAANLELRCGAHNRYEAQFENGVPKRALVEDQALRCAVAVDAFTRSETTVAPRSVPAVFAPP